MQTQVENSRMPESGFSLGEILGMTIKFDPYLGLRINKYGPTSYYSSMDKRDPKTSKNAGNVRRSS